MPKRRIYVSNPGYKVTLLTKTGKIRRVVRKPEPASGSQPVPLPHSASIHQLVLGAEQGLGVNAADPFIVATDIQSDDFQPHGKQTEWQKIKEKREENWKRLRDKLVSCTIQNLSPLSPSVCCRCGETEQNIIRCCDCGPQAMFCQDCYASGHKHTRLHYPEIWKDFMYVPYTTDSEPWQRGDSHACDTKTHKKIYVIDRNGRFHSIVLEVCKCEDTVLTLLRHQLWAASPKEPNVAVHLDLMEWCLLLQMEAHVSTKKFVDAVAARGNQICPWLFNRIYQAIIKDSVDEYSFYKTQLQGSGNIDGLSSLDDGTLCPPCHGNTEQAKVVCLDGNFGLVRKRSAGSSSAPPKQLGRYFIDQKEVDEFVGKQISQNLSSLDQRVCSSFQAGSVLRSKGKALKLDEKGVFGSTCKHDMPLLFLNLKLGERYAYPAFLLQEIIKLSQFVGAEKLTAVYDVACQFESHLQVHYPDLYNKVQLAVPVFHSYGHIVKCQLTKSLRCTPGVGLFDGESVERLWSYLRCFGPITKEMGPSKRIDVLTLALAHYSRKERLKLGQTLRQRLERSVKTEAEMEKEMKTLLQDFQDVTFDNDVFLEWARADVSNLQNVSSKTGRDVDTSEEYVLQLFSLYLDPSDVEQICSVQQFETNHNISREDYLPESDLFKLTLAAAVQKRREALSNKIQNESQNRRFLITMMKKYGIGQALSSRIGGQISKSTKKIKEDVQEYNKYSHVPSMDFLPSQISLESMLSPESNIFSYSVTEPIHAQDQVPQHINYYYYNY